MKWKRLHGSGKIRFVLDIPSCSFDLVVCCSLSLYHYHISISGTKSFLRWLRCNDLDFVVFNVSIRSSIILNFYAIS